MTLEKILDNENLTMCVAYNGSVIEGNEKKEKLPQYIPPLKRKRNLNKISFLIGFKDDWIYDICVCLEKGAMSSEITFVGPEEVEEYLDVIPLKEYSDELDFVFVRELLEQIRRCEWIYKDILGHS
jgi:hypothetical protein